MSEARRHIAWTLSVAARALPRAERQKFREFLASLPGATPRRRKVHSWHRKRQLPLAKLPRTNPKPARPARPSRSGRQLVLPFPAISDTPIGGASAGAPKIH